MTLLGFFLILGIICLICTLILLDLAADAPLVNENEQVIAAPTSVSAISWVLSKLDRLAKRAATASSVWRRA